MHVNVRGGTGGRGLKFTLHLRYINDETSTPMIIVGAQNISRPKKRGGEREREGERGREREREGKRGRSVCVRERG